ncbi:MAG: Mut7-C RNAse domain-containing protein [Bacteroidales bacterium]
MNKFVYIRLFGGLDFFVPDKFRDKIIRLGFFGSPSVKDIVESIGIPHTEFELVTVNGELSSFEINVKNNDHLIVYPHFYSLQVTNDSSHDKNNLQEIKFVVDVHLGKLAGLLRLLGFDALYRNDLADDEIIKIANTENRIVLSRDLGILKNSLVKHGYFPRSQDPKIQLKEVMDRFNLNSRMKPFSRCIKCNGELRSTKKELIKSQLQENTRIFHDEFYQCINCKKIYWKGSHFNKMKEFIDGMNCN